jgi:hypothetical protein
MAPDLIVSLIAIAISILSFALSFKLSRRMADRSLNLEAHKMLLDVDRELITDPKLWAFFDDHPMSTALNLKDDSLQFRSKLEAFAYLMLNMFEIVLVEAPDPVSSGTRNPTNIWCDFFYDCLTRSSILRSILERPNSARIYNTALLAHYQRWQITAPAASVPPTLVD